MGDREGGGLRFVCLGNVPGHAHANTLCPQYGMLLVGRTGMTLVRSRLQDGQCPACGLTIPGVWGGT